MVFWIFDVNDMYRRLIYNMLFKVYCNILYYLCFGFNVFQINLFEMNVYNMIVIIFNFFFQEMM